METNRVGLIPFKAYCRTTSLKTFILKKALKTAEDKDKQILKKKKKSLVLDAKQKPK